MSGPAFTPGPWAAWMVGKTICILGPKFDHDEPIVAWSGFDGCHLPLPKQEANARLIAAAPELFAELQQFVNGVETRMIDSPADETLANITRRAKAALAKARGDQ